MNPRLRQLREFAHHHTFVAASTLVTTLALIANAGLWWHRHEVTREHEEVRRRGEVMAAAVADRARIQGDVAALEDALDQIERNLAAEESMEVNLGYFYRLEKLSRVRLERIDQLVAAPAAPGSAYRAVPVSLLVEGSYRNLLGFIRELETGPRVLRIRDYRMERDEDVAELHLQLTVELLARP
jgi:Tfp pilus assembly protein PilO